MDKKRRHLPKLSTLRRFATAIGVPMSEFFPQKQEPVQVEGFIMSAFLRSLPIFLASMNAIGMGVLTFSFRMSFQHGIVMPQYPGPYITTGVLISFSMQERRIKGLEERLQKLDGVAKSD